MRKADTPVEKLYAALKHYRLPPKMESCPHCELDQAETRLRSKPLREIDWEQFGVYPRKAMTTFGDTRDFKHFLPRLIELWVEDPFAPHDALCLPRLLTYGEWQTWPRAEREAISEVLQDWCEQLAETKLPDPIDQKDLDEIRGELEETWRGARDAV